MPDIESIAIKLTERIKNEIEIFPTWDGRQLNDKKEEFTIHRNAGYTYKLIIIEKALLDSDRNRSNGTESILLADAYEQIKSLNKIIKEKARLLAHRAQDLRIPSAETIKDAHIKRIAEDIMKCNVEKCVVTVPDLWFPTL